jgi:SAM-dependent methyltransferase
MFLRKPAITSDPLAVTMTGVRLGERLLQIGAVDAKLAAQLAAKPGLSGHVAIVVTNDRDAERARAAVAQTGALVDVRSAPIVALPFGAGEFDVIVLHGAAGALAPLDASARSTALAEMHRVLREGGRIVALEPGAPTGLSAILRSAPTVDPGYETAGGTIAALEAARFKPVRLLADRDGTRFIEGIRPGL